ncbi:hypothetical protein PTKU46_58640 [Paraburkholderia terrae]|uniref:hypothetical protein n=1 Tax=Paraburkholderia terrae TaxID=311230 RepID=UPI0030DFF68B
MGFQAKRVPLDFDWPLHQRWKGYVNPFDVDSVRCPACVDYPGFSLAMQRLRNEWTGAVAFRPEDRGSEPYWPGDAVIQEAVRCQSGAAADIATFSAERTLAAQLCDKLNSQWRYHLGEDDVRILAENDCLLDFTHEWKSRAGPEPKEPPYVPTPREVNDATVLGRCFDEGTLLTLFAGKCELLGLALKCSECEGYGRLWPTGELRSSSGAWQQVASPAGEGFQMWSSVESCPVSPVFAGPSDLAKWMTEFGRPENFDIAPTYEVWLSLIEMKWAVPMFIFKQMAEQAVSG